MLLRLFLLCSVLCWTIKIQAQSSIETDSIAGSHVPYHPRLKSFALPSALILLGAYSIHQTTFINSKAIQISRDRNAPNFHSSIDDWLQHAPIVVGFAYGAIDDQDRLWLYTKRLLLTTTINNILVLSIKKESHILRPDGEDYYSFPSGHTANAFAAATLFSDHFARNKPWIGVLAYASASTVGVFRVLNNKHWAHDVVAGAGFGILSAKLSQLVFREKKKVSKDLRPID